jgi:hypothetical protein
MKEPAIGVKSAILAGLIFSYVALFWLFTVIPARLNLIERLGYVSAIFCALAVLSICWAALFAYVAAKRNWTVQDCRWVGVWLLVPASLLLFADKSHAWPIATILTSGAGITSYVCRKMAFPGVSDEDAARLEPPPTMFPK